MNAAYGSSGSVVSRERSKSIVHNTYTGIIISLRSKPTPEHGPVHKSDLNYSYLISHFSLLPQVVDKELINRFYQKVSYVYMKFYPVINGFSTIEVISNLHIWDNSITTFDIRGLSLGFSNTSHIYSLERFRKKGCWEGQNRRMYLKKDNNSKYNNMKIKYAN